MFGASPAAVGTFLVSAGWADGGGNDFLHVIRVDNPLGAVAFTGQFVMLGNIHSGAAYPDAPQLGSAQLIDTGDARLLNAVWRNNQLYAINTVLPTAGADAGMETAHWYRVNTSTLASLFLADQGNVGAEDLGAGTRTYWPSLGVNRAGDMAVNFAASSPSIYPGAYYTARLAGDAPGSVQPTQTLAAGIDYYYRALGGTRNRWGDYCATVVDPSDDATFWVFNEYALARGTVLGGFPSEDGRWGTRWGSFSFSGTGEASEVVGRHLFYNQSFFDGNNASATSGDDAAIDTSKSALLPGGTGSFSNYSGYSSGLNGMMVDIAGTHGTIGVADLSIKVGNNNSPGAWATGPSPISVTLRAGAGVGGSDRYTLIWANNAIQNQWAELTVLANANTNLAADDVFYLGNAIGDVGNTSANAIVSSADEALIRVNFTTGFDMVPVTSPYDINKNRFVQTSDAALSRANQTTAFTALRLIVVPPASGQSGDGGSVESSFFDIGLSNLLGNARRRRR
jgi:hypothetical protein